MPMQGQRATIPEGGIHLHGHVLAPLTGALCALLADVFYIWLVANQGEGGLEGTRVRFIAGSIAAAAALLVASSPIRSLVLKAGMRSAAAVVLASWAVVASLSIGFLLLPAALLAFAALRDVTHLLARREWLVLPLGASAGLVVVALGLYL